MTAGFAPPPPGVAMCAALVAYSNNMGTIGAPRPCKRAAADGLPLCRLHQRVATRVPHVDVRDGGICVWCGGYGRSYVADGVTIGLCVKHGLALARAIREGR